LSPPSGKKEKNSSSVPDGKNDHASPLEIGFVVFVGGGGGRGGRDNTGPGVLTILRVEKKSPDFPVQKSGDPARVPPTKIAKVPAK